MRTFDLEGACVATKERVTSEAGRRVTAVGRVVEHARGICREEGVWGLMGRVGSAVGRRLGLRVGQRGKYLKEKERVDRAFDGGRGTDTGGVQNLFGLTIAGENAVHGGTHIAVDPGEFAAAVAGLEIDVDTYRFVDLGSGKGRAVLLAAEMGFKEAVGVEFARELHAVAERNVAAFGAGRPEVVGRIRLVHGDAAAFAFPGGPLVVFLFNPFDGVICGAVARRLRESWEEDCRPVKVVYMNPVERAAFEAEGWKVVGGGKGWVVMEVGEIQNE